MNSRPMLATPAIAIAEYSSLRKTFSTSRLEIMLPAVARRSPATTTPRSQPAATIVVACGRFLTTSLSPAPGGSERPRTPGSNSGEYEARKSENEAIRGVKNSAGCQPLPSKYADTRPSLLADPACSVANRALADSCEQNSTAH